MVGGIVLIRRSELPDMLSMSNLIVVKSDVEVQALRHTGSVNAEDMGHTGEIK